MLSRFLGSQSKTITGAALVIGVGSFGSRAIGMVRDRILAHYYGAGELLDAYYAAFRIPDFIYNLLIIGALSAGFIPIFVSLFGENKEKAWRVVRAVMTDFGLALLALSGFLFLFAPFLIPKLVPGFSPSQLELTIQLTRIMLLSPLFLGTSSIVSGILQTYKLFFISSLSPIMYNAGIIIGAIVLVPSFGPAGLALGVVLGALLHLGIQLPALWSTGFRYRPVLSVRDPAIQKLAKTFVPRTLGLAAAQINLVILTILASLLGTGSISVFQFATNLQYVAVGIIGISFATAAFPVFASFAHEKNTAAMASHLMHIVRQILFFILPTTIIFLLLRAQIVRVVLGTGGFDWSATIRTADALAFFSLSLFAQCLIPVCVRALFALGNTWMPFFAALAGSVVNVIGSLYLMRSLGVAGLALAFSLSAIIQLIILWFALRRALGTLEELSALQSLYKMSAAALLMALIIQLLKEPVANLVDMTRFWGIFTQGVTLGILGLTVYAALCSLLRLPEFLHIQNSITERWGRLRGGRSPIGDVEQP